MTLTYNEDNVPFGSYVDCETGELITGVRVVDKSDIQKFFHDLRRNLYGDFGGSLRYFVASEYGPTTLRPHYHVILFNFPDIPTKQVSQVIESSWHKGFVQVASLNKNRIRYVCKYCLTDAYIDYLPVFNMMSQGIGRSWLSPQIMFSYRHSPRLYTVDELGYNRPLHRYYIDKLWPNKYTRKLVMVKLLNNMFNEQTGFAQNSPQDVADSFGSCYQIDRCQRTLGACGERDRREIAFGPEGAWLTNYYSKLKRSKFEL